MKMGEVNFLSYNVKGLQNKEKRVQIFNFCKEKGKNGIVLLQETHSSLKDVRKWKKEWGSDIYLNHGSSNSRGTLIAFPNGFEKKVLRYIDDKNGVGYVCVYMFWGSICVAAKQSKICRGWI